MSEVGVTWRFYFLQTLDSLFVVDLLHGLAKSVFFGYFIAIIGCYIGMDVRGGTEGVGRSTTTAVVSISIVILVSNYLLTNLFVALYG